MSDAMAIAAMAMAQIAAQAEAARRAAGPSAEHAVVAAAAAAAKPEGGHVGAAARAAVSAAATTSQAIVSGEQPVRAGTVHASPSVASTPAPVTAVLTSAVIGQSPESVTEGRKVASAWNALQYIIAGSIPNKINTLDALAHRNL